MSSTVILAVWPGVRVCERGSLSNSWGSAPHVWNALWREAQRRCIIEKLYEYDDAISSSHADDLWPLWKDPRFPVHQRAVLALTFDRWYVKRADYERLACDIEQFFEDYPLPATSVNHWPTICELLRSDEAKKIPALGFWWTTVSDNPMATYRKRRDWSRYYDLYAEIARLTHE